MQHNMQWMNEPPRWSQDSTVITVASAASTDFWRVTHYGFIRDNGHFYYATVPGDFTLTVKFSGSYRERYDQAGVMLRQDERHWIKCGVEWVNDVQHASAVVTNDYSDWSVLPLPQNPPSLWLRIKREGDTVEIAYALDGAQYTLLRLAYLPPSPTLQAGIMCASPDGSGFETRFEDLTIQPLENRSA